MISEDQQSPFRAGGVLPPHDPAIFEGIYRDENQSSNVMRDSRAKVICSPKMTGKTTQLSFLLDRQAQHRKQDTVCVAVEIPKSREGIPLVQLQEIFASAAESDTTYTLPQVVNTSRRLAKASRKVLAIVGADNLEEVALKWLLSNIRSIVTGADRSLGRNVMILIDGSFAVDTLTVGPNSEYPLPQLFPREFKKAEQRRFVADRLDVLGIKPEAKAVEKIWQVTKGDKFLTQLICGRWYENREKGKDSVETFAASDLDGVIQSYVKDPFSDDFKASLLHSCWEVVAEAQLITFSSLLEALPEINHIWDDLAVQVRAAFYRGGVVRRISETEVDLRAPLLLDLLRSAEQRRLRVQGNLELSLPLEGVRGDRRDEAGSILSDIRRAAFCGSLRALHTGVARQRRVGGVKVTATTLDGDNYTAIWEVEGGLAINQEAWAILWAEEPAKGSRISRMHLLPLADRPHGGIGS